MTWDDAIHGHTIALKDGGRPGVLSEHSILSAISRPYDGYHRPIHKKASALLHGVISNHGFADANKRTALYLAELLIERSGYKLVEADQVVVETIVKVASGELRYEELEAWFKERLTRINKP